jgi:hypothetical protein
MRNPVLLSLLGFAGLLVLSGCATLSREQCLAGDWHQIGVQDGHHGHYASRLNDHRSACRDTPAIIDEAAYRAGRQIGLRSYCTPQNGFRVGSSGNSAPNVCPSDMAANFLQAHGFGHDVYQAEQEVAAAERQVRRLASDLEDKERRLQELRASVEESARDPNTDVSGGRLHVRQLRREVRNLREELQHARFAVESTRDRLADVRNRTSVQLQILTSES